MKPLRVRLQLLVSSLCVWLGFIPQAGRAFDSGHHWELTSQVLHEMGFSVDARQTACVSNWMLDYYSSSPTGSRQLREELSKLHCDNLYTAESARHYLAHFTHNAKTSLISQSSGSTSDREVMLLLGAVLHVVQDLYSHSNWLEQYSKPDVLSNHTWSSSGERVPPSFLTGSYDPRPYVAETTPEEHPLHGSYHDGMHKDSHDRQMWPQAYYLAYCASREFVEAFRTWIPEARWNKLRKLNLDPLARLELNQEMKAAYGISLWIDGGKIHGHWKGGNSGHKAMFLKCILSFLTLSSRNALWYRTWKGYRPLIKGLYTSLPAPRSSTPLVPGLHLKRTAVMLQIVKVCEKGTSLDHTFWGKPDFYLSGGAHYGKPRQKPQTLLGSILEPKSEPISPFDGKLNSLFRDRVIQASCSCEDPWKALIIADDKMLAANHHVLTFFLDVGEEDPGRDDIADISPARDRRGLVIHYDVKTSKVTLSDTGAVYAAGRGKPITTSGDQRHSVELTFEIYSVPTK